MNRQRRLDVLISTYGNDGIERVARMALPEVGGVTYVVSWQLPLPESEATIPAPLRRHDVIIYPTATKGLSVNRNNALRASEAPLCLIADDDLSYTPARLQAVIDTFDRNPDVDLASFMYEGADSKRYPEAETDLTVLPKNFYISSIEIAFRREAVARNSLSFNENFGVGAPLLRSAEDAVFLLDARRAGLRCRFFPIVITRHEGLTTGSRAITDRGVAMAEGAYIWLAHRWPGALRVPLFAWRNWRAGRFPLWWGLRHVLSGYRHAMKLFPIQ